MMAHTYSHLYGIPTTGLRFFTVYGPWGRPDMALFKFTEGILSDQPIPVFNKGQKLLPMQDGDVPATFADIRALEKDFGNKPRVTVDEGVARFVEWYLKYYEIN